MLHIFIYGAFAIQKSWIRLQMRMILNSFCFQ